MCYLNFLKGLKARRHTLNTNHGKKRKPLGEVALEKATVNNVLLPKKALLVIENAVSRFFVSNQQCFAAAAASASLVNSFTHKSPAILCCLAVLRVLREKGSCCLVLIDRESARPPKHTRET